MKLDGASILVTGASSGIGAELAPLLAERGATVGVVARRRERLAAVLERCGGRARGARLWVADLGEPGPPDRVVREAWLAFGHLDCVVANAAIPCRVPVQRLTAERVAKVMDVDFFAPVRMALGILPRIAPPRLGAARLRGEPRRTARPSPTRPRTTRRSTPSAASRRRHTWTSPAPDSK